MQRPLLTALAIGLLSVTGVHLSAETLNMPDTGSETFSITLPGRGMTMEQVEKRFGAPKKKNAPVGTPPITTWEYERFIVYFEDRYVIHSVFLKPN